MKLRKTQDNSHFSTPRTGAGCTHRALPQGSKSYLFPVCPSLPWSRIGGVLLRPEYGVVASCWNRARPSVLPPRKAGERLFTTGNNCSPENWPPARAHFGRAKRQNTWHRGRAAACVQPSFILRATVNGRPRPSAPLSARSPNEIESRANAHCAAAIGTSAAASMERALVGSPRGGARLQRLSTDVTAGETVPQSSSGAGLGIHQPGSASTAAFVLVAQGRARDRAMCPAGSRSFSRRRGAPSPTSLQTRAASRRPDRES